MRRWPVGETLDTRALDDRFESCPDESFSVLIHQAGEERESRTRPIHRTISVAAGFILFLHFFYFFG